MPPSKKITGQHQVLRMLILLPTIAIVLAAAWISGMAILENIRFAKATSQILILVKTAHDIAFSDKNFATQPNEDILDDLTRAEALSDTIEGKPVTLRNPWQGSMTSLVTTPSIMRIESIVPSRACRRMALFFARTADDLGLKIMEARDEAGKSWRRFYDRASTPSIPDSQPMEAACGDEPRVTLALVFALR